MRPVILREPDRFARRAYDLVVVGGGIYGVTAALEASRRGLRVLLLERGDFGGGTSWNSLRILHGGLRYLQSGDLPRFVESVRARRWFLRTVPSLTRPLPCLMPLYGRGLERPALVGAALRANDALAAWRNRSVPEAVHLPASRLLSREEALGRGPGVPEAGLRGAALWFDALMVDPPRILTELLRWAVASGADALNYTEAVEIERGAGRATGVVARDGTDGRLRSFPARGVLWTVGPDPDALSAAGLDPAAAPPAGRAVNVLLNRPPPSRDALAVRAGPGEPVQVLVPTGDQTLAGTLHEAPADEAVPEEDPTPVLVDRLSRALPSWGATPSDVVRVLRGVLPTRPNRGAELASRPSIRSLADRGMENLVVVVGVKYTTAPAVAPRAVARVFPGERLPEPSERRPPPPRALPRARELLDLAARDRSSAVGIVREVWKEESVVRPEDLVYRRVDWGLDPARGEEMLELVSRGLEHRVTRSDGEVAG